MTTHDHEFVCAYCQQPQKRYVDWQGCWDRHGFRFCCYMCRLMAWFFGAHGVVYPDHVKTKGKQ